jgi:hypothetical protein
MRLVRRVGIPTGPQHILCICLTKRAAVTALLLWPPWGPLWGRRFLGFCGYTIQPIIRVSPIGVFSKTRLFNLNSCSPFMLSHVRPLDLDVRTPAHRLCPK